MRISKEDYNSGESTSIENQRKILTNYANENSFQIYGEYIDDGYSGTNMERPALIRMKADIESGKISIVITKDFSRLGRNTGQVMTMLDDYFVKNHIRYIAVSEGIDTQSANLTGILAPILSFTNEMYAGDISRKINASFGAKMLNGEFIGAFAPYGYRKDPQNKNHLLPDKESSEIVTKIFTLAKNGYSPNQIAKLLNNANILTPSLYRCKLHPHLNPNSFHISSVWTASAVSKLLRNEVYLGHTLQGKTHKPSFKSKFITTIPKNSWIRVNNTHQPLTDIQTWEIVRCKLQSRTKKRDKGFCNIFSGIAKCLDCGRNMSTVFTGKSKRTVKLVCGNYKQNGTKGCSSHSISYEALYSIVLKSIKEQINFTEAERQNLLSAMLANTANDKSKADDAENKLALISAKLQKLYDDKYSENIEDDIYQKLLKQYNSEKLKYETIIKQYKLISQNHCTNVELTDSFRQIISYYENPEFIDNELLFNIIERIDIHQGTCIDQTEYRQIDIFFKFKCEPKSTDYQI